LHEIYSRNKNSVPDVCLKTKEVKKLPVKIRGYIIAALISNPSLSKKNDEIP
jgi:hypothetical protein